MTTYGAAQPPPHNRRQSQNHTFEAKPTNAALPQNSVSTDSRSGKGASDPTTQTKPNYAVRKGASDPNSDQNQPRGQEGAKRSKLRPNPTRLRARPRRFKAPTSLLSC